MSYTPDALMRIWRFAGKKISEVENAVEYMLRCHKRKADSVQLALRANPQGIPSPKGWLHRLSKIWLAISTKMNQFSYHALIQLEQ